ncbi:MAG: hypothetical protein ACRDIE_18915 [Chloroflexota bacterium]
MLEVLRRFQDDGPYPEAAFREAGFFWTRIYAAEVLARSDPIHFSRGLAVECPWDREDRVREIGCDEVSLRVADVLGGSRLLAHRLDAVCRVTHDRASGIGRRQGRGEHSRRSPRIPPLNRPQKV